MGRRSHVDRIWIGTPRVAIRSVRLTLKCPPWPVPPRDLMKLVWIWTIAIIAMLLVIPARFIIWNRWFWLAWVHRRMISRCSVGSRGMRYHMKKIPTASSINVAISSIIQVIQSVLTFNGKQCHLYLRTTSCFPSRSAFVTFALEPSRFMSSILRYQFVDIISWNRSILNDT